MSVQTLGWLQLLSPATVSHVSELIHRNETYAVYFACRYPAVPWYAKLLVAFVVAHTFQRVGCP